MKFEIDTTKIKASVARTVEESPVLVVGAVGAFLAGGAKLIDSNTKRKNAKTAARNSKTYAKEIDRRLKK